MALPARVRVSKLKTCPGEPVLNILKPLSPRIEELRQLPEVSASVASAGGQIIGFAVFNPEGALPPEAFVHVSWQKRGIEEELLKLL